MQKIKIIFIGLLLINVLPLLMDYELITHWKNVVIMLGNIILWAYHPQVLGTEAKSETDKKTFMLIFVCSFVSLMLMQLQWAYFSSEHLGSTLWNSIGVTMIFGGVFFRNYAIYCLGKQFTSKVQIVDNHQLITIGPYRFLRHPSYTGAYLAMIGIGILLQTWLMLCLLATAVFYAYYKRIEAEEATLSAFFGEKYQQYQSQSKRMFPAIW